MGDERSASLHFLPYYMHLVLFSTNHGWFVWTPITALGVLGLFYGARKATAFYRPCILVIFLEVAVMGSMPTNWHNSESFGIRSLTSCVPLIGLRHRHAYAGSWPRLPKPW